MIKENRTNREIIDNIVSLNKEDHDFLKLAEETTELSEVLIKMVTKPNRRDERIGHLIEEMGDVKVRMDILLQRLGLHKEVDNRYQEKLDYINNNTLTKKYENY